MNYVLAIVTQFNAANAEEVIVKARGRAISTAVDVAEVTKNRFLPDMVYKDIRLGTDIVKREDGSEMKVSTFEITLSLTQLSAKREQREKKPAAKKEQREKKPAAKKEQKEKKPAAKKEQREKKPAAKKEQREKKPAEE
jgi:DNA-binding protein